MSKDRQLLFGILALQTNFIDRAALVDAFQRWSLDPSTSLGAILVEGRRLTAPERDVVEELLEKHLARWGGDAHKSLGACLATAGQATVAPRDEFMTRVGAVDGQANLANVLGELGDYLTRPTAASVTPAGERFVILRPHRRGGLGEVSVALDKELNREVAFKEIQSKYADHPENRARFLLEAEVTGGLEHPGIVPVYGLGVHADGRPFYAMRFIRGESLGDAITRFHSKGVGADAAHSTSGNPNSKPLELRGLLRRFVDVCNAIDYAHSRGVLHRDLKPSNIMLGKHGETLVVDWGLAKAAHDSRFDRADDALEERPLTPASGGDSAKTRLGSAIGTPAFMSPEQAAGRLEAIGPASDIYGLGATLYVLLTGKSAFTGDDVSLVVEKVKRGEFPRPRQALASLDPALEAICLKAMALAPQNRYQGAGALADDVERWLADEPTEAYPEPFFKRAIRWSRRHRAAMTGMVALIATSFVALVVGIWAVKREEAHTATERDAAIVARKEADRNADQARKAQLAADQEAENARLARDEADVQRGLALRTLETTLFDIQTGLETIPAAHKVREDLLAKALAGFGELRASLEESSRADHGAIVARVELASLLLKVGVGPKGQSATEEAAQLIASAKELATKRASDDPSADADRDLELTWNQWGDVKQRLGDSVAAKSAFYQALAIAERLASMVPNEPIALRDLSFSHGRIGNLEMEAGQTRAALEAFRKGRAIDEKLVALQPKSRSTRRNLSIGCNQIGIALSRLGDSAAAARAFDEAIEIRRRLLDENPADAEARRDLAISQRHLGDVAMTMGNLTGAKDAYQSVVALAKSAAADDPDNREALRDLLIARNNLGLALAESGASQEAREEYEAAREIAERLAALDPADRVAQRDVSISHDRIGGSLMALGDAEGALASWEKSMAIVRGLVALDPLNQAWSRDLAIANERIGDVRYSRLEFEPALESYRAALEIRERRAKEVPGDSEAQRDRYVSLSRVGDAYMALGDLEQAGEFHRQGLEVARALADADPSSQVAKNGLSIQLNKIGDLEARLGRLDEALTAHRGSLAIAREMATADPANAQLQRSVAFALNRLGDTLARLGDADLARESFLEALAKSEKLLAADPSSLQFRHDVYFGRRRLANVAQSLLDADEMRAQILAAQEAVRPLHDAGKLDDPAHAGWWADLESTLARLEIVIRANADFDFIKDQEATLVPDLLAVRAVASVRSGDLAAADIALKTLRESHLNSAVDWIRLARSFGLCATELGGKGSDAESEQNAWRARAVASAFEALEEAIKLGWTDRDAIEHHPAFYAWRDTPEFTVILARIPAIPGR